MTRSQVLWGLALSVLMGLAAAAAQAQPAPASYDSLLRDGVQAREAKQLPRAIDLLTEAYRLQPADPRAALELAVAYEWSERLPDAERVYRELLARQPGQAGAMLGLARVLRWRWQFDESQRYYQQVLVAPEATPPMRREAELGLAQIDRLDMRLPESRTRLQSLLQQNAADPEVLGELEQLDNTSRHRLQVTLGERDGPIGRNVTWLAGWSTQLDARTLWKAGVAHNTAGQPTLATDVPVNDVRTLWFTEARQFVPQGQALWGRAEWRQMYTGPNQYQVQGEWSDQLAPRWRGNAGFALSGPDAAMRRVVSAGASHQFLPSWDAGLTAYAASGGPAPSQQTWLARLGWERAGALAQLFVSKDVGQPQLRSTALLRLPLPDGYQLRLQVSRDGVAQVNAWSIGLIVPFGRDVGVLVQHDVRNDERATSVGADIAIRHPFWAR